MKEIGSEYWREDDLTGHNGLAFFEIGEDRKFLMSGRTAIDFVIQDIDITNKKVYLPDYCCDSVIQPFMDNGYTVEYYSVDFKNKKYVFDNNLKCGIFFATSYFGYSETNMDEIIKKYKSTGVIVIEDITHRLLSENNYCSDVDYLICSLRKWFPILSGGLAVKINGMFKNSANDFPADEGMIATKTRAMNLKNAYINQNVGEKDVFMDLYAYSNDCIKKYHNKGIDKTSLKILDKININGIKHKRKNNAKVIHEMLSANDKIKVINSLKDGDIPLFVPVLVDNKEKIQKTMIQNEVFLPSHWPSSLHHQNDIYEHELSLICDHRYDEDDISEYMKRLLEEA